MTYNPQNIFAKILRGEIPCQKVYEDDHVLAFHDIHPQAKIHILVIPKGAYTDMSDFAHKASENEIASLFRAVAKIAKDHDLESSGYRILSNQGANGGQEVPHLHIHLFGGQALGPMLTRRGG
jgi:histidine triad (HIT) family protein